MDQDEGLPLAEAIEAYGDPELWAAYESARAALDRIPSRPPWLHSSRQERDAWSDRYEGAVPAAQASVEQTWRVLALDFRQRLQRAELIAMGFKRPITERSERIVVPAHLWSILVVNFRRSRVKADDLAFVDVRVWQAKAPEGILETSPPTRQTDTAPEEQLVPGPGRPSIMGILEDEMRRRAERGELCDGITQESRALRAWAERHVQGEHIPLVDSICKALRKLYQSLRAEINGDK